MPSEEFAQLVDAHYTSLFRFALSLARHPADASDLTQQTFLIWAQRGHELRDSRKAKSWLFTTLYREFLRSCQRANRVESLEDISPAEAELTAPDIEMFPGERTGAALEALSEIDEVYRVPLTLFYLKEFSYKEIAELLGVPIGTVMSRLARGKTQLVAAVARRKSGVANRTRSPGEVQLNPLEP